MDLLRSPNQNVQQAAAGALRNLVFRSTTNKLETRRQNGIREAVSLLRRSGSTEIQKQLTGRVLPKRNRGGEWARWQAVSLARPSGVGRGTAGWVSLSHNSGTPWCWLQWKWWHPDDHLGRRSPFGRQPQGWGAREGALGRGYWDLRVIKGELSPWVG